MKKYWQYLQGLIALEVIITIISFILNAGLPVLIQVAFDAVLAKQTAVICLAAAGYGLATIAGHGLSYLAQVIRAHRHQKFFVRMKNDLYLSLLKQKKLTVSKYDESTYLGIWQKDIDTINQSYFDSVVDMGLTAAKIIIYLGFLMHYSKMLSFFLLISALIGIWMTKSSDVRFAKAKAVYLDHSKLANAAFQTFFASRYLIDRKTRGVLTKRPQTAVDTQVHSLFKMGMAKAWYLLWIGVSIYLSLIVALVINTYLLFSGHLSAGGFISCMQYADSLLNPIRGMTEYSNEMKSAKSSIEKILSVITIHDLPEERTDIAFEKLTVKNLQVIFPDFVFGPFNYQFEKGKKYLLLGPSGSGKSTLLRCLENSLDYEGEIKMNDVLTKQLCMQDLLGSVHQKKSWYLGSYHDNVSVYGAYAATADVQDRFMLEKREDVASFSEGQKQIMALYRTLNENKEIILLDESFSAIDYQNRQWVEEMFVSKNKTMIFVLHDLDPLIFKAVDEILYFQNGQCVFSGSQKEFLEEEYQNVI